MARILVGHGAIKYYLAQLTCNASDGSIYLQLVREGTSDQRWNWGNGSPLTDVQLPPLTPKTKYISIHTTGRINYRMNGQALVFDFQLIPASELPITSEIARCTVVGRYGLRCLALNGDLQALPVNVPEGAFTILRPTFGLRRQAIDRPLCFIRYRQQQYQLGESGGVIGPDKNGVWEAICSIPMRIHPKLSVTFHDDKYLAIPISIAPDERLQNVRVKFYITEKNQEVALSIELKFHPCGLKQSSNFRQHRGFTRSPIRALT